MTTRVKTLWYVARPTNANTTISDATLTALPSVTVYTENSSRIFRSVRAWLNFEGMSTLTGNTLGEHRLACSVNGAAATTVTETDDISNSGENLSGRVGPFDFTAHFSANYPGADSSGVVFSVYLDMTTGTGLTSNNVSVLFCITYQYDDSAATQYKTAIIPLESTTSALATSETEIGTNQIPQLTGSGGLLENVAGVTVRQQFFVVEGNHEDVSGTTSFAMNTRIDTGTTQTHGTSTRTLGSDTWATFVHIESPSAGSVHAFKAWTTSSGAMNHCSITMYVTYQWTVSGTTKSLNSIMLTLELSSPMGGTGTADVSRFELPVRCEEPGTLVLKQSAVRLNWISGAAALTTGPLVRIGGQAYRTYVDGIGTTCGGQTLQQRIDSGGAQGAGFTLARGKNNLVVDVYRTGTTNLGWNVSGLAIINYTSDVSANGDGAHNHTTVWGVLDWDAALTTSREASAVAPNIPETNYWVTGIGFEFIHWDTANNNAMIWACEIGSGEGEEDGWRELYADTYLKDAEIGTQVIYCRARADMRRWPNDPDPDRLAVETARRYRYSTPESTAKGVVMFLTHHSITFTVGGNITGSSGGTVDIDAYTEDADGVIEHIGSTSRSGNGSYSITWYDNVYNCYAEARESGTLIGRSDNGTATGSP